MLIVLLQSDGITTNVFLKQLHSYNVFNTLNYYDDYVKSLIALLLIMQESLAEHSRCVSRSSRVNNQKLAAMTVIV